MQNTVFVGIDVSLASLSVAVSTADEIFIEREFDNSSRGRKRLCTFLSGLAEDVRVCVEPTSSYHLALCHCLHAVDGISVHMADPRAAKDFARGLMKRSKTDRGDARMLAAYMQLAAPAEWTPPPPHVEELRCLARHVQELTQRRAALKNRRHALLAGRAPAAVLTDIDNELDSLKQRMASLRDEMLGLIRGDSGMAQNFELLLSVPGIGQVSALKILAEVAMLPPGMGKRQWTASAGLDPRAIESGSSIRRPRRLSKRGNARLRQALFLPALVSVKHCSQARQYYERLQDRGQAKLAAICAVMRKLLIAIWGMFNTNTMFDPNKFSPSCS